MTFNHPAALAALSLLPLLAALYVLAHGRRRRYTLRFTNAALLASVAGRGPGVRRHVPPALLLMGLGALLFGLAGPVLYLEVARSNASVMLVIDVSGSMQATDVQPTRLAAAEAAARTLIDTLPANDRVGLISFNGSARLEQPPTDDRGAVLAALGTLQAGGATAIGDALSLAVRQLAPAARAAPAGSRPASMIVLLTDGVANSGIDPLAAAAQARSAGIAVQAVGIGRRDASVRVHGQLVGGVDEQALQGIAEATGGKYFYAEESGRLAQIYGALGSQFGWQLVRFDTGPYLVGLGLFGLVVAAVASLLWFRVLP